VLPDPSARTVLTVPIGEGFNTIVLVNYQGGWPALLKGHSQRTTLTSAVEEINRSGRQVVAITTDRWSFWQHLGWGLLAVITLGFTVKRENLLVVTAPQSPLPLF
jgi:hypothetical protein